MRNGTSPPRLDTEGELAGTGVLFLLGEVFKKILFLALVKDTFMLLF